MDRDLESTKNVESHLKLVSADCNLKELARDPRIMTKSTGKPSIRKSEVDTTNEAELLIIFKQRIYGGNTYIICHRYLYKFWVSNTFSIGNRKRHSWMVIKIIDNHLVHLHHSWYHNVKAGGYWGIFTLRPWRLKRQAGMFLSMLQLAFNISTENKGKGTLRCLDTGVSLPMKVPLSLVSRNLPGK